MFNQVAASVLVSDEHATSCSGTGGTSDDGIPVSRMQLRSMGTTVPANGGQMAGPRWFSAALASFLRSPCRAAYCVSSGLCGGSRRASGLPLLLACVLNSHKE